MIKSRDNLKEYLAADFANNTLKRIKCLDWTRKYLILLRKSEFHMNTGHKIRFAFYRLRLYLFSRKTTTFIPPNCFDKGLSIGHFGCIYVNKTARIGKNCRIHECVNIGATNGSKDSPVIGDNVFIGTGAKIIGAIHIANDVAIGAGAVVVKNIDEPSTTWGGVPAKKISNNDSHSNLKVFGQK